MQPTSVDECRPRRLIHLNSCLPSARVPVHCRTNIAHTCHSCHQLAQKDPSAGDPLYDPLHPRDQGPCARATNSKMSEAIPDDAWVQSFLTSSPKPLFDNLKQRLQASNTHVNAISELYKQRAQIEAHYADSLAKLAKTAEAGGLNGKQGTEWERSGGEAKVWNMVVSELVEVSLDSKGHGRGLVGLS